MNSVKNAKIQEYYKNKSKIKKQINSYVKLVKEDIMYLIINRLATRYINTVKIKKTVSHLEIIGCSCEELKSHITNKFQDGMTFENYGEWELDHIYPISKYDLTNLDQIKECFNYKNIQPLWKLENRIKSNKIIQSNPQDNITGNL